jgi:hypothetical protein
VFTDRERRRLRAWLETGEEDQWLLNLFVDLRVSMDRITGDVELLTAVARRLREEGRIAGRARLPGSGSR